MKRGFLREKAILQIILLITAIVYFSYAIKPVQAAENTCCEKTINDQYCFYGDSANCDPAFQFASVTCEQTSFCKIGCCYDVDEGQCYRSVPQAQCLSLPGGEWYSDEDCSSVLTCEKGCCVLGSQCSLRTEQSCALQTAKYPDLEMVYNSNIKSESECVDICRAGDKGCCINIDDSCVYETRESCGAAGGDFLEEQFCSDVAICGCAAETSKTCYDDDVYWVDSCGNLEDVAEDCDYATGTLCKRMEGEYRCGTVDCETTYSDTKNKHDSSIGGFRENGESWCIYESPTGNSLDRPGSRHYRHMCVNGEEVIESCRDYREEICTQSKQEGIINSQCLHNDIYESVVTEQVSTVPKGQRFWEEDGRCAEADSDCPVIWNKENAFSDWKCEANCNCEEEEYIKQMAMYCKTLGDCGADYNVLGKFTHDGYTITGTGREGPPTELSDEQTDEWEEYGVFGGMAGLYETIIEYIQQILERGVESEQSEEEAQAETQQYGMYAAMVLAVVAYAIYTGALLATTTTLFSGLLTVTAVCWACLAVVIIAIIIVVILTMTGDTETFHVKTECSPWVPPDGGADCEKCLDQDKVDELEFYDSCTEYKCKSLGKNCEFIDENSGTERVACFNAHPNDVSSPMINPWEEALTEGFSISNIAEGYQIIPEVPYYTKITFGIQTDELSQCKVSQEHKDDYASMTSYFGDSFYQREHEMTVNPQVGGQVYDYYIRCKDGSGNSNANEYVIRFTTEDEPDMTPPILEGTNIDDYGYIKSGMEQVGLAAYINEPTNCKWSFTDQLYNEMENDFKCEDMPTNALTYDTYACYTILNVTEGSNTYYFRCEDKSENLNQNQQSYSYHLTSTNDLIITSQSPEGVLYDTVSPTLYVSTAEGAEAGDATCYYSDDITREEYLWPEFYETGTSQHSQDLLSLSQGEHTYYIRCLDIAGNEANTTISFTIDKDVKAPEVEYIYMDSVVLHIILDEPSTCEYNNQTFSYGEGNLMSGAGTTHNTVSTSEPTYYVNCEDIYYNHWNDPIIIYL